MNEIIKKMYDDAIYYGHRATENGVAKVYEKALERKSNLLSMMQNHPNYNGNMQIVMEIPFEREIDRRGISNWFNNLSRNIPATNRIRKTVNEEGKSSSDLLREETKDMPSHVSISDLTKLNNPKPLSTSVCFDRYGYYIPSLTKERDFSFLMDRFSSYYCETISGEMADRLNSTNQSLKIGKGMKTSRALNKVFTVYGFKDDENYKKHFPLYSDCINTGSTNRKVVISVNPIDYLRMSFGNTWSSCHTIDINGKRNNGGDSYHGMRCNGTVGYMLDECSFIMYVVNEEADTNHPEDRDKIYRCMFHYKDGNLIQGRVYPQSNDGCIDLYKKLRYIMQEAICVMLGIEYHSEEHNNTWKQMGATQYHNSDYNNGSYEVEWDFRGHGYPDVTNFGGPNLSIIKEFNHVDPTPFIIGEKPICFHCGKTEEESDTRIPDDRLAHNYCNA